LTGNIAGSLLERGGSHKEEVMVEAVDIKEAAELSDYSAEYVRRLAQQGKIEAHKITVNGQYQKWKIDLYSLMQYKINKTGTWRGRRRYKLYIHPLDEERVREVLYENDIEFELEVAK
jgi:hypothetical protein